MPHPQTQEAGFGHIVLASNSLSETGEAAHVRTLCGNKTTGNPFY